MSRPLPEATTSWQLVGHCAPRFSIFQGAATGMKAPRKMSDKLLACRRLHELSSPGSDDKLAACRTLRPALFNISGRRDRHEGSFEKRNNLRLLRTTFIKIFH